MRKTPVVLGVLSIIFGAVTAVLSLLTLLIGPMFSKLSQLTASLPGQTEVQRAQMEAAEASFTAMQGYMRISSSVYFLMSAALVVVGVGLYRRRAWARGASVGWSLVGLVLILVNFVAVVAWIHPRQMELQHAAFAAHGVTPPFEIGAGANLALMLFSALLYAAYPTVILALIGRRSAVRDFLPAASSATPAA